MVSPFIRVKVFFKTPVNKQSEVMFMREHILKFYEEHPKFSPYKRIVRLGKMK